MKAIKTLIAVSVLAAAGAAEAATVATFDYSDTYTTYGLNAKTNLPTTTVYGSGGAIGTGVLDDNGTLTLSVAQQFTGAANAPAHQYDADLTLVLTGTYDAVANTFTATTSASTVNSCTANYGTGCTGVASSAAGAYGPRTISLADGAVTSFAIAGPVPGQPAYNSETLSFTAHAASTPTVPVPAAAWLFGSGLLGLAGTARRRKAS